MKKSSRTQLADFIKNHMVAVIVTALMSSLVVPYGKVIGFFGDQLGAYFDEAVVTMGIPLILVLGGGGLYWVVRQRKRKKRRLLRPLALLMFLSASGLGLAADYISFRSTPHRLLILVTNLHDPSGYGEEITTHIQGELSKFNVPPAEVDVAYEDTFKPRDGPEAVRMGKNRRASIVVWGTYTPLNTTTNPPEASRLHVATVYEQENGELPYAIIKNEDNYQSVAGASPTPAQAAQQSEGGLIAPTANFTISYNLQENLTYASLFFAGLHFYQAHRWDMSMPLFRESLLIYAGQSNEPINSQFLNPDNVYYYLGRTYIATDHLRPGAADIRPKVTENDFTYALAMARKGLGQLEDALSLFHEVIAREPDRLEALYNRGNVKDDLGDYAGAVADFTTVVDALSTPIPADPHADTHRLLLSHTYNNRGVAENNQNNFEAALADFELALGRCGKSDVSEQGPDSECLPAPKSNMGVTKFKQKDYPAAIEFFQSSIRLTTQNGSRNAIAYYNLGQVAYEQQKDYQGSIGYYTTAIRIDPTYYRAYLNRGVSWALLSDNKKAMADISMAIKINPQYSLAYFSRGLIKFLRNDYNGAIADYTVAIRLVPNRAFLHNRRGLAEVAAKKPDAALADYTKALSIDPGFTVAYVNRGMVEFDRGNFQKSILDFTRAIEQPPAYADTYRRRGDAYNHLNLSSQARADYNEALRLGPNLAAAYVGRSELEKKLGRAEAAKADMAMADQKDPQRRAVPAIRWALVTLLGFFVLPKVLKILLYGGLVVKVLGEYVWEWGRGRFKGRER